jgi:potassium efflux system protein
MVVLIGLTLSRRLARLARRVVLPRLGVDAGAAAAFEKIANYAAIILIFLIAFKVVDIPLTAFAFLGGAAAIALGFGGQNLLNNFMSGLILMAEQPVQIGDFVEIDGTLGTVEEIGGRSTRLRAINGNIVFIPNSALLEKKLTNWTRVPLLRNSIALHIAYNAPARRATRIMREALDRHGKVERSPEPLVLLQDFGENGLRFEMIFWVKIGPTGHDARIVLSDVRHMILNSFREANITIAFPQRDVHLNIAEPVSARILPPEPAVSAATLLSEMDHGYDGSSSVEDDPIPSSSDDPKAPGLKDE